MFVLMEAHGVIYEERTVYLYTR